MLFAFNWRKSNTIERKFQLIHLKKIKINCSKYCAVIKTILETVSESPYTYLLDQCLFDKRPKNIWGEKARKALRKAPPSKGGLRHYTNKGGRKTIPTRRRAERRHNYLHTATLYTTHDFNRVPYNVVEMKANIYFIRIDEIEKINCLFFGNKLEYIQLKCIWSNSLLKKKLSLVDSINFKSN